MVEGVQQGPVLVGTFFRGYRAPASYEQPPSQWRSVQPAAPPGTRNPQHNTQSEHTGEQEPRSQDTVRTTQHTERAHR